MKLFTIHYDKTFKTGLLAGVTIRDTLKRVADPESVASVLTMGDIVSTGTGAIYTASNITITED